MHENVSSKLKHVVFAIVKFFETGKGKVIWDQNMQSFECQDKKYVLYSMLNLKWKFQYIVT